MPILWSWIPVFCGCYWQDSHWPVLPFYWSCVARFWLITFYQKEMEYPSLEIFKNVVLAIPFLSSDTETSSNCLRNFFTLIRQSAKKKIHQNLIPPSPFSNSDSCRSSKNDLLLFFLLCINFISRITVSKRCHWNNFTHCCA